MLKKDNTQNCNIFEMIDSCDKLKTHTHTPTPQHTSTPPHTFNYMSYDHLNFVFLFLFHKDFNIKANNKNNH